MGRAETSRQKWKGLREGKQWPGTGDDLKIRALMFTKLVTAQDSLNKLAAGDSALAVAKHRRALGFPRNFATRQPLPGDQHLLARQRWSFKAPTF